MTSPSTATRIPVNEPRLSAQGKLRVLQALDAGWLSGNSPVVEAFEARFAGWLGSRHAVATPSGTTALHLALAIAGIGPGDEVIVPDFTMIAPIMAVLYCGATPILADCDPDTFNLDPDGVSAAISPRTRAILAVHLYGHPADMPALRAIASRAGVLLIEDAAEALGASCGGRKCGTLGDIATFSFYANKLVTTGEGGMVVTDDAQLAARARHLRDLAHIPGQRFHHDALGFSYRMSSLQAAYGLGQLDEVDEALAHRRWMAEAYQQGLADITGLQLPITRPWAVHSHWMYTLVVQDSFPLPRPALVAHLAEHGIETRNFFASTAGQPLLREYGIRQGPFPVSERIAQTGLYLPSGLALTAAQLARVCAAIHEVSR